MGVSGKVRLNDFGESGIGELFGGKILGDFQRKVE